MIKISNLHKSCSFSQESIKVLKGIDLEIKDGQIIYVLGPSGSGKSILLNILDEIKTIDEGEVGAFDNELESTSRKELEKYRRNYVGLVFQFYSLTSNLDVLENIEVGKYLSNNPVDIDDLINDLGLKEHIYKFPNEISGGRAQRTLIGRAIIKRPKLLICDEPTGVLDYGNAKNILVLIEKPNKLRNSTIIITAHNAQISRMCDVILSIHNGPAKSIEENKEKISASEVTW